ncbi:MAG: YdcF family protein [Alphaproteobacteria bacterium]|nr:YdcF family protein [Alphaproteobacteria bacterium]
MHRILLFNFIAFSVIYFSPFSRTMLYHLEHRFPQIQAIPSDAKGLILLGGSFSLLESQVGGRPIYNLAGGRVIEFISLARRYPNLPILFTGTSVEVELTKKLFDEMGIESNRVTWENESTNTIGNAYNSYKLVKPKPDDKWVLVTSAFHIPRSVGLFRGAGWNVIAYPVDYHIPSLTPFKLFVGFLDSLNPIAWRLVTAEGASLFNNYITSKSPEFIPR